MENKSTVIKNKKLIKSIWVKELSKLSNYWMGLGINFDIHHFYVSDFVLI